MKIFLKQKNKCEKGFTLVETLVALSVFMMSVITVMSVLGQGISETTYAKKKMTAAYLAQEGIEYVRNMRDTFMIYDLGSSAAGWTAFKNKVIPFGNTLCGQLSGYGCYFGDLTGSDYTNPVQPMAGIPVISCGSSCSPLLYDGLTGKYNYTSGTNSGFTRKIVITQLAPKKVKVSSTVSWSQGSGIYQITFSEVLFDWTD